MGCYRFESYSAFLTAFRCQDIYGYFTEIALEAENFPEE